MTRRITEVLAELDGVATRILRAPHVAFGYKLELIELRIEVAAAVARPATERVIDDTATMLVICLINMARDSNPKWGWIAEVLHPHVQDSLKAAREQELKEMTERL